MNRLPAAALALAACLGPVLPAAPAVPFTVAFFSLKTEMESRRDGVYAADDLTAAQKKELRAILKALKTLDKVAESVGDDIQTAGKVAKTLEKAFPAEFAPGVVLTLGDRMQGALNFLHTLVNSDFGDLQDRQPGLVDSKSISGVQKALDDATRGFDAYAAASIQSKSTRGLLEAWNAIQKGIAIADRDSGGGGTNPFMTATVQGVAFTAIAPSAEIQTSGNGLQIFGTDGAFPAAHRTVYLLVLGVTGTGSFSVLTPGSEGNLQEYPINNNTPVIYPVTAGTLTVTTFDPPNRVAGTFFFDATAPAARTVTNGEFDITDITVN